MDIPRMIIEDEGSEEVLVGSNSILKYLDSKFGPRDQIVDPKESEVKVKAVNALVAAGAYLPAILRFGRGKLVDSCALSEGAPRPSKPVVGFHTVKELKYFLPNECLFYFRFYIPTKETNFADWLEKFLQS